LPRGKALGGSTVINCNFYVWGSKYDYDGWEQMGATGWGFDDVIEHFLSLEDCHLINISEKMRGDKGNVRLSFSHKTPLSKVHFGATNELGKKNCL